MFSLLFEDLFIIFGEIILSNSAMILAYFSDLIGLILDIGLNFISIKLDWTTNKLYKTLAGFVGKG